MLTLFMRKDIARARVLAADLDRYRDQLHYTWLLGEHTLLRKMGTPKGLLVCFGAGCLTSLYLNRYPGGARSVIGLLKHI